MSTIIKAKCVDQKLKIVQQPDVFSGGVNEDKLVVEFCPLWDGYTKIAVFYRTENEVFHMELSEDNSCIIPPEVLLDPGHMFFGVFGIKDDITRTSEVLRYTVKRGAITQATAISEPTPNIYEQILKKFFPSGGTEGQVLCKKSDDNYNMEWRDPTKQKQTDWAQNDSTAEDFLKNKTHYSTLKFEISAKKWGPDCQKFSYSPGMYAPCCIEINGIKHMDLTGDACNGDEDPSVWDSGEGMGFYIVEASAGDSGYYIYIDTARYGPIEEADIKVYSQTYKKKLAPEYLPIAGFNKLGVVTGQHLPETGGYAECAIDDFGFIYAKEYKAANIYPALTIDNLRMLSYKGDHGLFTDSIAEEISNAVSLSLPVHAWYNGYDYSNYSQKYVIESADGSTWLVKVKNSAILSAEAIHEVNVPESTSTLIVTLSNGEDGENVADHTYDEIVNAPNVIIYDAKNKITFPNRLSENVFVGIIQDGPSLACLGVIFNSDNTINSLVEPILGTEFYYLFEEFANNVIVAPSAAKVGQTIVVSAVDDTGAPTAWEPADLPTETYSKEQIDAALGAYITDIDNLIGGEG